MIKSAKTLEQATKEVAASLAGMPATKIAALPDTVKLALAGMPKGGVKVKTLSQATREVAASLAGMSGTQIAALPDSVKIALAAMPNAGVNAQVFGHVAELQKQIRGLASQYSSSFAEAKEASRRLSEAFKGMGFVAASSLTNVMAQYRPVFARIQRTGEECRRIEAAGWLPHYTTPFDKLAACNDDPEVLGGVIAAYYVDEWQAVESKFLDHLSAYDIGDESKATFAQALRGHGAGLYRLTARALFPEIERVVRDELEDGSLEPITSQRGLRKLAGRLGLQDTKPGGMYAMSLFRKLLRHQYENTKTNEQLEIIAADSVPNRHASLHGLLSYAEARNSVNALVMTDFVFQIVCALKRRAQEDGGSAAETEV